MLPGILHGVVEEIGHDRAQFLGIAADDQRPIARRVELDGARMKMMANDRQLDAFVRQRADVHRPAHDGFLALADDAGLEHLIDGAVKTLGIGQHDVVELATSASR